MERKGLRRELVHRSFRPVAAVDVGPHSLAGRLQVSGEPSDVDSGDLSAAHAHLAVDEYRVEIFRRSRVDDIANGVA
jgi:hypothetical protein